MLQSVYLDPVVRPELLKSRVDSANLIGSVFPYRSGTARTPRIVSADGHFDTAEAIDTADKNVADGDGTYARGRSGKDQVAWTQSEQT